MGKHSEKKKNNKVLKIFLRILLILIILIVILAGIAVGYISNKLGKLNVEKIDETAIGIDENTKNRLSGFRNIALLGIDSRADDYGVGNRSDCIIIASLNEKTKQTIRVKLEQLIELGLIKKHKNNKIIYNQDLYTVSDSLLSFEDNKILGIIEGKDLNYEFHYLMAMIINKFRTYTLSGINELTISVYQLKIMLGVNNSESSIRNVLNQLAEDNYITIDTDKNVNINTYIINTDKIINNYSLEDIKKYTEELVKYYEEYLKRMAYYIYKHRSDNNSIDYHIKLTLNSFKNIIKKLFESGKADYYILKHIMIYLIHNIDLEKYTNPRAIKKEYNELAELSKNLSKRKAKRFIYKFQNDLLNEESSKALNKIYWDEAQKFIDNYKSILRLKYFESRAGVNYIEVEDYYQEALHITYKILKKYNITDITDNEKFSKEILYNEILYRLKEYMYNKRDNIKVGQQKDLQTDKRDYSICITSVSDDEYYFKTINNYTTDALCSNFLVKEDTELEQIDIEYDTNTGINKLFSILDERSQYVVKKYTGYDGQALTFREIGEQIDLTESLTARIYKKAIQKLKEHFPPDREQEIRQLIFKT